MNHAKLAVSLILGAVLATAVGSSMSADPCGMVPPITIDNGNITRVGLQNTYVFYKDGVETFVIRPGFSGNVEEFGMLIPFPTPPALRKVSDDIFPHLEKAVDPPEVVVYANMVWAQGKNVDMLGASADNFFADDERLAVDEVRVLRQEAVGMYEVAVLEAGSAAALKRWMDDHQYRFPDGMDATCEEYVTDGWCFVAVKTSVGPKKNVDPQPGMRETQPGLPPGASFDGAVQAMGFRFQSDELVVPMRLSAFNDGELRNIVYILSDGPRKIRAIPEEYVVRQLGGQELLRNLAEPLPLRIVGGTEADISASRRQTLPQERDPAPHNSLAKELFAGDLLTANTGVLSHSHEESEKMLLRIGESLLLRGPEIDAVNYRALADAREANLASALADLENMTLTVVDGDFPREVLGSRNLTFAEYSMPARRNNSESYHTPNHGPGSKMDGPLLRGALGAATRDPRAPLAVSAAWKILAAVALGIVVLGVIVGVRRRG